MRLIDADALKAEWPEPTDWMDRDQTLCHITWFRAVIDNMPTIDPVKHGRWIKAERQGCWSYADVYKQCSECGKVTFLAEKMNYCPNCGADMRGETGC